MRVKKVPLQDLELWPDEVICFTAYTDTRNPVQQRRTYVDGEKLKAKNAKLRADLETQCEVAAHNMNRNAREYKRVRDENDKLRELAAGIGHLLFTLDVDYCAICPRDDINHPCPMHTVNGGECLYEADMRELGIEVPE